MTEVESSAIVILSEDDDDDDDDIVVLKEEKMTVNAEDSDSDEVIFISRSQPTVDPKGKTEVGQNKPDASSSKDLRRSLSITTSLDLSLTLNDPLDLSKHTTIDLACNQTVAATTGPKVEKEIHLLDLEEADSQQSISHDLLGSISDSSLDKSLGGPESPDNSSSSSDSSRQLPSSPCSPAGSWKWDSQPSTSGTKTSITQNPSSLVDSVDKTSPDSVFDQFLELLKTCDDLPSQASTDNQPCVSSNSSVVLHSNQPVNAALPTIQQFNICDPTTSSSTQCLSVARTCTSQVDNQVQCNAITSVPITNKPATLCVADLNRDTNSVETLSVKPDISVPSANSNVTKSYSATLDVNQATQKPQTPCTPGPKPTSSSDDLLPDLIMGCGSMSTSSSTFVPTSSASKNCGSGTCQTRLAQHSLPPRKRARPDCLSTPDLNISKPKETCVNCKHAIEVLLMSRCIQGHPACSSCLGDKVKLILTDKQGSLECISTNCDSYYQISELKLTLPTMVVEILEEKVHKDNIDFVADMLLKYSTDSNDQPSTSKGASSVDDISSSKKPKMGDDDILDLFGPLKDIPCSPPPVKKLPEKNPDHPQHWDPMESMTSLVLMKVEADSEEFVDVAVKFHDTLEFPNADIVRISRVQNPILWKYYNLKRTEMIQEHDCHVVDERQLFHGTSSSVLEAICRKGFDWRVCGKHGSVYGQGSYFAKAASYSHQYTERRSGGGLLGNRFPHSSRRHMRHVVIPRRTNVNPLVATKLQFAAICTYFNQILPHQLPPPPAHMSRPFLPGMQGQMVQKNLTSANNFSGPMTVSSANTMLNPAPNMQPASNLMIPPKGTPPVIGNYNLLNMDTQTTASGNPTCPASNNNSSFSCFRLGSQDFEPSSQLTGIKPVESPPTRVVSFDDITSSDTRKMFLAKVLVGKYTGGNSGQRRPPPLENSKPYGSCYDSCVDHIWDPKIFVIFDTNQAYPEYIIEYNVVNDL